MPRAGSHALHRSSGSSGTIFVDEKSKKINSISGHQANRFFLIDFSGRFNWPNDLRLGNDLATSEQISLKRNDSNAKKNV